MWNENGADAMPDSTVLKCAFPLCPGIQREKKRVFAGDEQLRDHPAGKENGLESTATSLCFQGLAASFNQEDPSTFFSFFSNHLQFCKCRYLQIPF